VIDQDVELVDVAPTLLDLTGAPVPPSIRGRSLLPAIDGDPLPPAPIFAELMPATAWPHQASMMVDGDHKVIHRISDRRWEMYDLRRDPGEKVNLADQPAAAEVFARLKQKLVAFEERPR
ncbi:MAG TPA: sulfatase/phosphatase domain-containing protein, partial [Polyangia bacterium]|nr:sulfatase/phosphatase domain-containing protein [Polyangia bacterium]